MSETRVALRASLVWRDEVMEDIVLEKPRAITIGSERTPTFVVPNVGLPQGFGILQPGNRGYLLTLGPRMRGTISVGGREQSVAEFVAEGTSDERSGGFRGTPIGDKDWGVVELDESGEYKVFFQFVKIDGQQAFFSKEMITFGLLGWAILAAALAVFLLQTDRITTGYLLFGSEDLMLKAEAAFIGVIVATGVVSSILLVWWLTRQDGDTQASLAFSILLHGALLFMTYQLYDPSNLDEWPGRRDITASYLAARLETEQKPDPTPTVTATGKEKMQTAAAPSKEKPKNTATKNAEGAAGGKGEHERARDPNAKDAPPSPPKVAFFEDKNKKILDSIDQNLQTSLNKFEAIPGERKPGDTGYGNGTGGGVGTGLNGTGSTRGGHGNGTGGGGHAEGDFVSTRGKIDTGKDRPGGGNCAKPPCGTGMKEVKVALSDPEGDFGGLTADEINRVVKARAGVFRACYQKELNRSPGIGGKLVVHFVIGGDGSVKSAKTGGGSSLRNDEVESCVSSNIMRLKFPAKGGQANVNYPFVFQPGG